MPAHVPIINGIKYCSKCKDDLPEDAFGVSSVAKHGKNSWCKKCRSDDSKRWFLENREKAIYTRWVYKLRTKYGITPKQYSDLLLKQSGVCALCRTSSAPRKHFDVDHSHSTSKVRGLLCRNCNNAVGLFADDLGRAERAVLYLFSVPQLTDLHYVSTTTDPVITAANSARIKYLYGVSDIDYLAHWRFQGGLCAICYGRFGSEILCVDHDHSSQRVRGLLCRICNLGIGKFKDRPQIIATLRDYIDPTFTH